ncbi:four helix bundle protein [Nitrospira sp. NS4]|uniref:four helix bundle protein n=1 Tax=Nitrospira sp. NS4 TaxID=3414498 RepID=UPI003C2EFC4B
MGHKGFKDLAVWQEAKNLAVLIYKISDNDMPRVDFGLRDQIRRSAVSVASNLAEGDERDTDKESVRYFFIAKGSVAELRTQLQIAHESGHLNGSIYETIEKDYATLGKRIGKLIQSRCPPTRP